MLWTPALDSCAPGNPRSHLDLDSVEALLDALEGFEGAVVAVSHHRHFVASYADELWLVRGSGQFEASDKEPGEAVAPGGSRLDVRWVEDDREVEAIMDSLWPAAPASAATSSGIAHTMPSTPPKPQAPMVPLGAAPVPPHQAWKDRADSKGSEAPVTAAATGSGSEAMPLDAAAAEAAAAAPAKWRGRSAVLRETCGASQWDEWEHERQLRAAEAAAAEEARWRKRAALAQPPRVVVDTDGFQTKMRILEEGSSVAPPTAAESGAVRVMLKPVAASALTSTEAAAAQTALISDLKEAGHHTRLARSGKGTATVGALGEYALGKWGLKGSLGGLCLCQVAGSGVALPHSTTLGELVNSPDSVWEDGRLVLEYVVDAPGLPARRPPAAVAAVLRPAEAANLPAPRALSAEVKQLVAAMGLTEGDAERLLRQAEGDVNRAIDLCLGSS